MKIDGSIRGTAATGLNTPAPVRGKENAPGAQKQDSVSLSNASAQLQALEASLQQASGLDTARVAAVKQAIDEGSYRVNPEQIADGMLASTRELIAQHKP